MFYELLQYVSELIYYFITFAMTFATFLSRGLGMMLSVVGFSTYSASAIAAFIFISSVIFDTLFSRAPLNIPGKTRTLLI
jgi:hypothetical protein